MPTIIFTPERGPRPLLNFEVDALIVRSQCSIMTSNPEYASYQRVAEFYGSRMEEISGFWSGLRKELKATLISDNSITAEQPTAESVLRFAKAVPELSTKEVMQIINNCSRSPSQIYACKDNDSQLDDEITLNKVELAIYDQFYANINISENNDEVKSITEIPNEEDSTDKNISYIEHHTSSTTIHSSDDISLDTTVNNITDSL